mmetsp:Transcript_23964/g.71642  ORF Transcript_23964/g.71642 Transcript_23964/m.71642 type:complete len:317 (-) Transcript_23964:66-1016(-)
MGKDKIKTKASKEAMRWADTEEAPVARGPNDFGNDFDIRMRSEPDGMKAAEKIVKVIKERGVCLVEANAPVELLTAAFDEAEQLWEDGHFRPPLRVGDDRAMLEAELWKQALSDEEKVFYISASDTPDAKTKHMTNALKVLAKNVADFSSGLAATLKKEIGLDYDRFGQSMLSCYTGDRQYSLHLDNPHGDEDDDRAMPDNGMRLTCTYFINVNWDPVDESSSGGLDIHLTDPTARPESMASARRTPKLRVAPHADTLAVFLSDRMAHQVIRTEGPTRWFALTLWSLNAAAMDQMLRKLLTMRQQAAGGKDDSDDD